MRQQAERRIEGWSPAIRDEFRAGSASLSTTVAAVPPGVAREGRQLSVEVSGRTDRRRRWLPRRQLLVGGVATGSSRPSARPRGRPPTSSAIRSPCDERLAVSNRH
jgi:hypothetical protein